MAIINVEVLDLIEMVRKERLDRHTRDTARINQWVCQSAGGG